MLKLLLLNSNTHKSYFLLKKGTSFTEAVSVNAILLVPDSLSRTVFFVFVTDHRIKMVVQVILGVILSA